MLVRNKYGKHADRRNAAIKVQAAIRCVVYRAKGQRAIVAGRKAAVAIQALVRKKQATLVLKKAVRAAVVMQAGQRAVCARKTHASLKTLDRLRKEKERKKARMIQAAVRRNQCRKVYRTKQKAVTKMATVVRTKQASQMLRNTVAAVVKLQSWARRCQATSQWLKSRKQAVVLQAFGRQSMARKQLALHKKAAARIKQAYKAYSLNSALAQALDEAHTYASKGQKERLQRLLTYETAGFGE